MSRDYKLEIETRQKVINRFRKNIDDIRKELGGTGRPEGLLKIKGEYVSTEDEIYDMYQVGSITERTRDKYIDKLEKILNNPEIDFIEGLIKEIERSIEDLYRYIGIER